MVPVAVQSGACASQAAVLIGPLIAPKRVTTILPIQRMGSVAHWVSAKHDEVGEARFSLGRCLGLTALREVGRWHCFADSTKHCNELRLLDHRRLNHDDRVMTDCSGCPFPSPASSVRPHRSRLTMYWAIQRNGSAPSSKHSRLLSASLTRSLAASCAGAIPISDG